MFAEPPLPEIGDGAYLRDAFLSVLSGEPLTWTELDAYARLTGGIEQPWEAEMIKLMDREYRDGRRLGEDPFSYAPME